ncbi:hypothetical protein ACLKA6_012800 [Drosophila palustris]
MLASSVKAKISQNDVPSASNTLPHLATHLNLGKHSFRSSKPLVNPLIRVFLSLIMASVMTIQRTACPIRTFESMISAGPPPRHQNEIWENQQEEQKQQQKWNLVKSSKIPTLFLPKAENIQPILHRLNGLEGVANGYTTKCTQIGAIRLLCNSTDVYNKISQELYNNNAELLRINCPKWIQEQLMADGYMPRFIRVMKHRHTGVPMNLFEVELQPTTDGTNEKILHMDRMGSQNIVVEKKKRTIDIN